MAPRSRPQSTAPAAPALPGTAPAPRWAPRRASAPARQASFPPMIPSSFWYGENLDVVRRHVGDEAVELVYLDPPFNSNRAYYEPHKDRSGTD